MTGIRIDYGRMLDVLGAQVSLMTATAHWAQPDRIVAAAPGLTLGETVRHVGSMYRRAHAWMTTGAPPQQWQREPAEGQLASEYLVEGYDILLGELREHQPRDPCATWYPPEQDYGFWARRMMHESVIHRGDIQAAARVAPRQQREERRNITLDLASDVPADIEPEITSGLGVDVAVDGVDEVLAVWFAHRLPEMGVYGNQAATVLVDTGDTAWLTAMDRREERVSATVVDDRELAAVEANAVVTGDPLHLYLWLWGRLPTRFVTVRGDDDAVAQMWALLRLATR